MLESLCSSQALRVNLSTPKGGLATQHFARSWGHLVRIDVATISVFGVTLKPLDCKLGWARRQRGNTRSSVYFRRLARQLYGEGGGASPWFPTLFCFTTRFIDGSLVGTSPAFLFGGHFRCSMRGPNLLSDSQTVTLNRLERLLAVCGQRAGTYSLKAVLVRSSLLARVENLAGVRVGECDNEGVRTPAGGAHRFLVHLLGHSDTVSWRVGLASVTLYSLTS